MKKIVWLLLILIVALSACSPATQPPSTEPPLGFDAPKPVTDTPMELPIVRYANFRVYDPVCVGVAKGFYEQEGIKVEFLGDTLGGPTAIQAVAAGRAEAALSSIPALINANAAGLPVEGVTDLQSAMDIQPLEEFFVRADSGIESLADLKGKKIAINLYKSSFHYTWLMAFEAIGVKEDEVEYVLMPFSDQSLALDAGVVDAIGLIQPYISMTDEVFGGKFKRLFTALDVFGGRQFTLHFVNRIWARENPEQAKAFVAGTIAAINYVEANQEEVKPIIAECTGVDVQYIPDYHFQPDGAVVADDVKFWLDYMLARQDVTATWLTPEDIYTNIYR